MLFIKELDSLKTGGIVFLGNSIIEGFDFKKHFSKTRIINRGIHSDHIDGLIERLATSVFKLQPVKLFILIGINDIGAQDSDSLILDNYTKLLNLISDNLPDTRVFIHSILPTSPKWKNCPPNKIVRLNSAIKKLAARYHYKWINIYSLFAGPNNFIIPSLTSDGLHLNHQGYLIWVQRLYEFGFE
jgi:lysophospholipase L1-like esterase